MNHRNTVCTTENEVQDYIDNMVSNARKHGILIQALIVQCPLGGFHCTSTFEASHEYWGTFRRDIKHLSEWVEKQNERKQEGSDQL